MDLINNGTILILKKIDHKEKTCFFGKCDLPLCWTTTSYRFFHFFLKFIHFVSD